MVDLVRYDAANIGTLYGSDDRSLAEKYGKQIAPFFRLEISDQSEEVLFSAETSVYEGNYDLNGLIISEVAWDENDCQASSMTLKVENIDVRLQDSRLFAEGNTADLWMGYDGFQPDYMGRGIVTEIEQNFPNRGIPSLNITLYDVAYFMMEEGKAEIVPEGTAWFERRAQQDSSSNNTGTTSVSRNIRDTPRGRDRANAGGRTVGGQPVAPQQTVAGAGDNVSGLDMGQTPSPYAVADAPPPESGTNNTTRTTSWQRAKIPRRRRKSGKVWRELRDDEIVEKIFWSYGIVPYTEASNQRTRGRLETQEEANARAQAQQQRRTQDNAIRDTIAARDRDRRIEQEEGLPRRAPTRTVERNLPDVDMPITPVTMSVAEPTTPVADAERQRTGGRKVVQKSGTSDWEFIKKLAKSHGYIVFVFFHYESKRWIGYWGPPQNVPPHTSYEFQYNAGDDTTLGNVKPRVSMRGQKTEIDLSFVDPRAGKEQRVRVSMDSINPYSSEFRGPDGPAAIPEPIGNGPQVTLTIHGQRVQTIANRPFTSMDDARRWLMAFWFRHATEFCQVEGDTIIGLPEMRARQKHQITGIGRTSGDFFITKATHSMKPGSVYQSKFSGYRVVDFLAAPVTPTSNLMTVDSNDLGQSEPEVV